jgi:hypothetical protein
MPYQFASEEDRTNRILLFTPCKTREEVKQFVHVFLNLELPDCIVDPVSTSTMLDMVWTCYEHLMYKDITEEKTRYLWFSSRFGGKTLCESVIEVLVLLHSRIDITHLAALDRQSRDCQKYIAKFFNLPCLKGFLAGDSKREKTATFFVPKDSGPILNEKEWKTLSLQEQDEYTKVSNTVEVIVATLASVNGKHTALLVLDEIDVMSNVDAYEEAKNIPTPGVKPDGTEAQSLTLLTSTRKFAFGLIAAEITDAEKTGLVVNHWNILDVCQACPESRHRPDLPKENVYISEETLSTVTLAVFQTLPDKERLKYQSVQCFGGCLKNCKMLPACKTHLATRQKSTSKFLKPIIYVQNQLRVNSLDKALAQLLCRKPSTTGLIYPNLSKAKHMISPAQAYERLSGEPCPNKNLGRDEFIEWVRGKGEWFAGIDWGFTHMYAFVMGVRLGNTLYITHAYGDEGLDPGQKLDQSEKFKQFEPKVWCDPEDPAMCKAFKKAGWRVTDWQKKAGSVAGGISIVQLKLNPSLGSDPEIFFVRDIGEDPMMELLFHHLMEHHYKLGPDGKVTDIPSDDNKDFPDALRYLVMNLFDFKGKVSVSQEPDPAPKILSQEGQPVYHPETWMSQKISELTGNEVRPPQTSRPPMTIEDIGGSYYAQQNKEEEKGRKGKQRGIVWNFD